jgi:mRNA-degrading endonuclease RelE of RelBE toxin-antitoxin system
MSRRGEWKVEFLPSARRELLALSEPDRDHVRDAIRSLADDPTPPTQSR